MPDQDAVIAITSESPSMQGELDLVWTHLLPAMEREALPANQRASAELEHKLATLSLPPPKAKASSPTAARISGKHFATTSETGEAGTVTFSFTSSDCTFTLTDTKGSYPIRCGIERWNEGETSMPGTPPKLTSGPSTKSKVAASTTWQDENTLQMTWRYCETPHHDTVTCHFEGDNVRVEFLGSLTQLPSSHKETRPVLQGRVT